MLAPEGGKCSQKKFAEFKSLYGTCLCRFEAILNGYSESYVVYSGGKSDIPYANCFLKRFTVFDHVAPRAMHIYAQKEEVKPSESRISIVGINALYTTLDILH